MRLITLIALITLPLMLTACGKKLPMAEPFDPVREMKKANEKLEDKYEEEARRIFENVQRLDSSGEYAPLAQLRIADSYVVEDLPDLAVAEYEAFLRMYPRHKYASYAQYQIGMAHFRLIRGPDRGFGYATRALDAFETLNNVYPRNPYRLDVEIKIMQCRATMAEHEYHVGDFYYKNNACTGASGRFELVRREYPEFSAMSSLLYRLAICYEKLEKPVERDLALEEMKEKFPLSPLYEKAVQEMQEIRDERAQDKKE